MLNDIRRARTNWNQATAGDHLAHQRGPDGAQTSYLTSSSTTQLVVTAKTLLDTRCIGSLSFVCTMVMSLAVMAELLSLVVQQGMVLYCTINPHITTT